MKNCLHHSLSLLLLGTLVLPDVAVADDSSEVRSLLPAAAGIPNAQLQKLATSPTAPKISEEDNQPLSLLCLTLSFNAVHASRGELERAFRFATPGGRNPKPSEIAEVMARTKLLGFYTMIHSQTVRKVTCEVKGDVATGIVEFVAANLFEARVLYRAARHKGKWRIEEFSLPEWQTRTVLQKDGTWTATGPAAAAFQVDLPHVGHGWQAIPAGRPQIVLTISKSLDEEAAGNLAPQIHLKGKAIPFEELVERLRASVSTREMRIKTTCVLRCDRTASAASLAKLAREVRRAGFRSLVMAAVVRDPDSSVELPFPSLKREAPKDDIQLPDIRVKLATNGTVPVNVWLGSRNLGTADKSYDRLAKEMLSLVGKPDNALAKELFVEFQLDGPVSAGDLASVISACLGRVKNGKLQKYISNFSFLPRRIDGR
jgi:biopolymer transport protein ExbD